MNRTRRVAIWYFFEGNDLYDDQEFENAMLASPPSPDQVTPHAGGLTKFDDWTKRSFVTNAYRRLRRLSHPIVPNRAPFRATLKARAGKPAQEIYFGPEAGLRWTSYEDERWATSKKAFETGIEFARSRGLHTMLVFVPYKYRVYHDFITDPTDDSVKQWKIWPEFPSKFLEFCETISVSCVDTTTVLTSALRDGVMVYPLTDTHWSPEGHAVVAAELERRLKEAGWVH